MNMDVTGQILESAFEVSNTLGAGFLEKVYQRALIRELRLRGIQSVPEASVPVFYKGERVGDYYADIIVENTVVVELKCVEKLAKEHMAQCLNYLKASKIEICLLINFQRPTVEYKRIVRSNPR
jgi:GxxExxY protein